MELPIYRLKQSIDVRTLSGGRLENELRYRDDGEAVDSAKRIVGFLAQLTGAELHIYNERGELIETKIYRRGVAPGKNELGNV